MKMNGTTTRHSGFALIELIAALFILTIGLFGVIQMYRFGLSKMRAMNESVIAIRAIQNEVETLRAMRFDELENADAAPFRSETPAATELANATCAVTICDYGDGGLPLKEVTVTLRWTGEHGRTITKSVKTLIADRGST